MGKSAVWARSPAAKTPGTLVRPIASTATQPDSRRSRPSWAANGAAWRSVGATMTPPSSTAVPSARTARAPGWEPGRVTGSRRSTLAARTSAPRASSDARTCGSRSPPSASTTSRLAMRSMSPATRATCGPEPRIPTGVPVNSWPWQYGQCAATVPKSSATPGVAGSSSRRPVASSSRRAVTSPASVRTTNPPAGAAGSSGATSCAAVRRSSTVPYAASVRCAASRNPAGGVPSKPSTLCIASVGSLRYTPESSRTTSRWVRPRVSAACSPAGPPPMMITSCMGFSSRGVASRTSM